MNGGHGVESKLRLKVKTSTIDNRPYYEMRNRTGEKHTTRIFHRRTIDHLSYSIIPTLFAFGSYRKLPYYTTCAPILRINPWCD